MSLNAGITAMMVVGQVQADDLKSKSDEMIISAADDAVLRENTSPRECQQRKESRMEPLALEINNDGEALEGSESDNEYDTPDKKKKRRRRLKGGKHHRKWKPYDKLSWSERRELEERETLRATQKREEAFAHGHPVAPYNTTQFLMEDHENVDPHLKFGDGTVNRHNSRESNEGSGFGSDSSEEYSTPEDESDFMEKEFAETYDNIHAERLQKMSKEELINDYIAMETKLERLEQRSERKKKRRDDSSGSLSSGGEEFLDLDTVRKLETERQKLKEENERLKNELQKISDHQANDR